MENQSTQFLGIIQSSRFFHVFCPLFPFADCLREGRKRETNVAWTYLLLFFTLQAAKLTGPTSNFFSLFCQNSGIFFVGCQVQSGRNFLLNFFFLLIQNIPAVNCATLQTSKNPRAFWASCQLIITPKLKNGICMRVPDICGF